MFSLDGTNPGLLARDQLDFRNYTIIRTYYYRTSECRLDANVNAKQYRLP
jgi:hypothetical protein